jgi:hypothetical protein
VVLTDARIIGLDLQRAAAPSTYEQEQVRISFTQILVDSLFGSTTNSSDDWT